MASVKNYNEFLNENYLERFPHEIKSEKYWRHIIGSDQFANRVLDTIMFRQRGRASARQYALLKRLERGDTTPYHPKNESNEAYDQIKAGGFIFVVGDEYTVNLNEELPDTFPEYRSSQTDDPDFDPADYNEDDDSGKDTKTTDILTVVPITMSRIYASEEERKLADMGMITMPRPSERAIDEIREALLDGWGVIDDSFFDEGKPYKFKLTMDTSDDGYGTWGPYGGGGSDTRLVGLKDGDKDEILSAISLGEIYFEF